MPIPNRQLETMVHKNSANMYSWHEFESNSVWMTSQGLLGLNALLHKQENTLIAGRERGYADNARVRFICCANIEQRND